MSRKTVRIEIPVRKPDDFSKLLNKTLARHTEMGPNSPLFNDSDIDMAAFAARLNRADSLRRESEQLKEKSEEKMQQAKSIYGIAKGQSIDTPGTLYFMVDLIKGALLKKNKGSEEALSTFGFNVVVGQAKSPKPKENT